MSHLPKPQFIAHTWPIRERADLRACLRVRPDINIYTGLEQAVGDGWALVKGSSRGHGLDMIAAESRIDQFLFSGKWTDYMDNIAAPAPKPTPAEYLRKPYLRTFILNSNGVYTAQIVEFQGCVAEGPSVEEAFTNLNSAAFSWIVAMQEKGSPIPEPFLEANPRASATDLHKLWTAVDNWRSEWPVSSGDELSRAVLQALGETRR